MQWSGLFLIFSGLYRHSAIELSTQNPVAATVAVLDTEDIIASVKDSPPKAQFDAPIARHRIGERPYMHAPNNNYSKQDLMNRTLRLVVPKIEPPYVNYVNFSDAEVRRRGYGPGVVIEILKELGRQLNLTYELVPYEEGQWGAALENGSWTGAFGMLHRKEADILGGAAIMQYDRSLITDLTFPFQYGPTAMLIRSPDDIHMDTWLIITAPFKWEVWELIGASILVSGILLYVIARCRAIESPFSIIESIWLFFAVAVSQNVPVQPRSTSCRVMLSFWWMAAITLQATFTGVLVAVFAVDTTATMPFNSIQQLVKLVQTDRWRIVMDGTTTTRTSMIRESESKTYKDLWFEMSVNRRVNYVNGTNAGVNMLLTNENRVFLGPEDSLKYLATIDCRLKKLEEGIFPTYLSIPFAKDSDYSTYASNLIRVLVERGFIIKWINDYTSFMASKTGNMKHCGRSFNDADKYLNLSKAQGAFWVLCGGLFIGTFLCVTEILCSGIRSIWKWLKEKKEHEALRRNMKQEMNPTKENVATSERSSRI